MLSDVTSVFQFLYFFSLFSPLVFTLEIPCPFSLGNIVRPVLQRNTSPLLLRLSFFFSGLITVTGSMDSLVVVVVVVVLLPGEEEDASLALDSEIFKIPLVFLSLLKIGENP